MGFRFPNLTGICRAAAASSGTRTSNSRHLILFSPENQNHSRITTRWHGGHSHHHSFFGGEGKAGDGVFKLGLAADIALATGKGLTGYLSGSTAILADAAHSMSDIVLSGVALWSFRAARAPKDKDYPYGHGKFESLGALGISCMLLVTAGGIAWHALDILHGLLSTAPDTINHSLMHENGNGHSHGGHHHGIDLEHPVLALSMTITSISVKEGLYWITKRAGDKEGSGLMKANAWHHRVDAISSLVALIGVGGAILGVPFLDPLAGLVVSGMVLKAGIESGYQSAMELVDAGVPLPVLAPIRRTIVGVDGVKGCHRLRGRRAGSSLYLDVHIEVDPFLSVSTAHDIGESVRHQIQKCHNEVAEVYIHIDPSLPNSLSTKSEQANEFECVKNKDSDCIYEAVKEIISNIFAKQFPERISLEHIIPHKLQGKLFLQVQVSMPPDMLIQDAMEIAEKARQEILKAHPAIEQVSIQLRLGHQSPWLCNDPGTESKRIRDD